MAGNTQQLDYQVARSGSMFLFLPQNEAARRHLEDHSGDEAQWFGGGLVVEHRYAGDLAAALQRDGFIVR